MMTYVDIGGKLFFGLIALLVMARVLGKKELAQLTPFDLIYAIVLGGLLEESVYDDQVSWRQIWFAVAVWGGLIFIVEKLSQKSDKFRKVIKGEASILIKDGQFNVEELNKNHLEMEQLRTMLRKQGVFSLTEVKDLYLESGGTISLKKYAKFDNITPEMLDLKPEDEPLNFLFIDEGEINEAILQYAEKSKEWLHDEIAKQGYSSVRDILYAEWSESEGLYIKSYEENAQNKNDITKGN